MHSLVPIAFAYVMAHYFTYLLFRGQAIVFLASDPLGDGSDLFGTANNQIDYGLIGSKATWYWQVGVRGGRPRGGPDAGARPGAGDVRRRQAGGALAVLDARR